MADEKNEILKNALMDIKTIKEALNANTKEILRSVAKEEIDGLVKESLEDESYEEEEVSPEEDEVGAETSDDESDEESEEDSEGEEGDAAPFGGEGEPSDEEPIETPDEVGGDDQDSGMDADALGGDEIDLTDASDDDVISIYKKLSGDDEIEVVGDEVHLNITEPGEYIVKKSDLDVADAEVDTDAEDAEEFNFDDDESDESDDEEDEMVYEIAMDDESMNESEDDQEDDEEDDEEESVNEASEEDEVVKEESVNEESEEDEVVKEESEEDEVVKEAIPVGLAQSKRLPGKVDIGQPHGAGAKGSQKESVKNTKKVVSEAEVKYQKLMTEAAQLKNENEEFRKALKKFRSMLVETVVFNSNLSYVTKLFMEHSTTKEEKKKIIQRFDEEVTNLKDSKKLYKTIANELTSRKPMNESVDQKIIKEVTSSASKQLNEANAYVDPSTQRIKDLIKRVENKDKY